MYSTEQFHDLLCLFQALTRVWQADFEMLLPIGPQASWNMEWDFVKWQSTGDINAILGALGDRCVGLGGLFPGLRWRGAFLTVSAFLQPAMPIFEAANILQTYGIGKNTPYLAGTQFCWSSLSTCGKPGIFHGHGSFCVH